MAPVYADHPFALIPTPAFQSSQNEKPSEPDMFCRVASEMAMVHNTAIRALNSIYLQAPHVSAADTKPFLQYSLSWYSLIHVHHLGEEKDFFPAIEEMAGEKGLMESNVKQHSEFHDGLDAFKTYLDACVAGKEKFDGAKLVTLIDVFGKVLAKHLRDEVPSILELRKFGMEKMAGMGKKFEQEGQKNMKALGLIKGLPFCFSNHDIRYEGGRWANWPPAPKIIVLLCRHITYRFHQKSWKFAACDRMGNMKPLYAVPSPQPEVPETKTEVLETKPEALELKIDIPQTTAETPETRSKSPELEVETPRTEPEVLEPRPEVPDKDDEAKEATPEANGGKIPPKDRLLKAFDKGLLLRPLAKMKAKPLDKTRLLGRLRS